MANVILVVGESGTGKSTSLRNLPSKETYLINCASKLLPFKGSTAMYSSKLANLYEGDGATLSANVVTAMNNANGAPHIKYLIIDDSNFVMTELFFKKSEETGYGKFTEIAKAYQQILAKAKTMRADLDIAIMMHEEDVVSNNIVIGKKAKTVGKLVDDQYSPASVVSIALHTLVTYDKENKAVYNFVTNRMNHKGAVIPAKSPDGMFKELLIPNDLAVVFKAAREYYTT